MSGATTFKTGRSSNAVMLGDFYKPFYRGWDPKFLMILVLSLIIESVVVTILANRPVPDYSAEEIARIQERFANFVLGESVARQQEMATIASLGETALDEEESVEESEGTPEGGGEGSGSAAGEGSGGEGSTPRVSAAEARRMAREAVVREVSNRGLLGLLTGTGSAAEGQAVASVFDAASGDQGVGGDLDRVLSSVNGLKTGGAPGSGIGGDGGTGVRGSRRGGKATIDDLVDEVGGVRSQSVQRQGELTIEAPAEVQGLGRRSVHRSPAAIQEVLLAHVPAIRYCYERELKRNPSLKGKVSVRITVRPDGSVEDAVIVTSTLNNVRVERCILARIKLWKDFPPIPPEDGNVTFRQVYTFGT